VVVCSLAKVQRVTFAGNISASETWELLKSDPKAQLVDVRTAAEWAYVGVPDLSPIGRTVLRVEWQVYPTMERNTKFEQIAAEQLKAAGASEATPIFFLCRSGARSQAAAAAMTAAGFHKCFNVVAGFEGDLNAAKHRGQASGWKVEGLPWVQA
jgi:rhodanese-related sulfurtransferase